jgi:hypothetical protein
VCPDNPFCHPSSGSPHGLQRGFQRLQSSAFGFHWLQAEHGERFKTVILLDGGPVDFAPRLTAPVVLVTGKYDWIFMGKDALLQKLGAPAGDKHAVTLETAHDVSEQKSGLVREVLAWLDARFGEVN